MGVGSTGDAVLGDAGRLAPRIAPAKGTEPEDETALASVLELCRALAHDGVSYCHFKSNEALDRSASGDNDLDFLVGVSDAQRFRKILADLGFKEGLPPPGRRVPGVAHYYALDEPSGRLVHVHAHYRLVFGDDTTKNYWLDIADDYLATSVQGSVFRVPLPEYEFLLFVLRMVVKHCSPDAILMLQGRLAAAERRELGWLSERADRGRMNDILAARVPWLGECLFERCVRSIEPAAGLWLRIRTAGRLSRALAGSRRRGRIADGWLRIHRRFAWAVVRLARGPAPKRPESGGLLVAIVGGDGAGKTTAVAALRAWLRPPFATEVVHLGKPRPSFTTLVVKGPMYALRRLGLFRSTRVPAYRLKASRAPFPGSWWLIWNVLTARDRYHAYRRARRSVLSGTVVVSDRFPLPMLETMDGPRTSWLSHDPRLRPLARALIRLEHSYYARIGRPDLLIVLRVDPEVAVARRSTEPDLQAVRDRSAEVYHAGWLGASVHVVDAGETVDEVQREIRRLVWSAL